MGLSEKFINAIQIVKLNNRFKLKVIYLVYILENCSKQGLKIQWKKFIPPESHLLSNFKFYLSIKT